MTFAYKQKRRTNPMLAAAAAALLLFLLLASFSLFWAIRNFGNISLNEIVFTLNMPLAGTSGSFISGFIKFAVIPPVIVFSALIYILFRNRDRIRRSVDLNRLLKICIVLDIIWCVGIFIAFDHHFDCMAYIRSNLQSSALIEREYRDPAQTELTFPEKKRNLIYIYLESAETSLQNKENGGLFDTNYIPEMTEMEKENISFSQNAAYKGATVAPATGWTVAGLVAECSGLPLKLFEYDDRGTDNSMNKYKNFMPGATMIGDILQDHGYRNVFMCGSNIRFAGRDKMLSQHGKYEIFDYVRAKNIGRIPKTYKVWWGMEDEKLYEWAKDELKTLAAGVKPFNFTMLTADTHHVGGYLSENAPVKYSDHYANVWSFSSSMIYEFVEWIKKQDFYGNTTVVICGDHCSMDPNFFADHKYNKHSGETVRAVYNVFINSAAHADNVNMHGRKFTTLDFFPTTLSAMGVKIEGDRLGIGTDMFSEKKTLSEELGYKKFFRELDKKSFFYNSKILYGE